MKLAFRTCPLCGLPLSLEQPYCYVCHRRTKKGAKAIKRRKTQEDKLEREYSK